MNKNKLILAIIAGVLTLSLIIFVIFLQSGSKTTSSGPKTSGPISIWIVGDSKELFTQVVNDFKSKNAAFSSANISIETFADTTEYFLALSQAFIAGKAPDIFVINNNEKPIFKDQTTGINPTTLDPQDFRKNFKEIFGDTLIASTPGSTSDGKSAPVEYVAGVPVGYETLGVFYNRRFFKATDMASWSSIASASKFISEKDASIVPVAMGNGSVTPYAADIISQFFLLEGLNSLEKLEGKTMQEALATYLSYGDANGDNKYNTKFSELTLAGKNAIDLFSSEDTAAIVGYPRMIADIDKRGFKKSFLLVAPFPHHTLSAGKTLANYNYFVINKNTKNFPFAEGFLSYLASEAGAKKYVNTFPYYLPARLSLEAELFNQKIHPNFNVILKDFYNPDITIDSFDKELGFSYDTEVIKILDDTVGAMTRFDGLRKVLLCKSKKIINLENLSGVCDGK